MTTRSQYRKHNRSMAEAREELLERSARYEWDRSDISERDLRAAAVGLALALLQGSQDMDPIRDKRPAISVLETYIAGCRSR